MSADRAVAVLAEKLSAAWDLTKILGGEHIFGLTRMTRRAAYVAPRRSLVW
jgi:hypothetical protein